MNKKEFARAGVVGETARWVADRFFEALLSGTFDVSKSKSDSGLIEQLNQFITTAVASRYPFEQNHSNIDLIFDKYETSPAAGLLWFTIAILAAEAEYDKNTPEDKEIFLEVIYEELVSKEVGDRVISLH